MDAKVGWFVVALVSAAGAWNAAAQEDSPSRTSAALGFQVIDLDGNSLPLIAGEKTPLTVVCFLGVECPLARLYAPRLNRLAGEFPQVRFLGVDSNRQDSTDELRRFRDETGLSFPVAKDHDARLADLLTATRTPEVVVLDSLGIVRYRGRIDDQYVPGIAKGEPNRNDLRESLQELVAGRVVSVAETSPTGCLIGRGPRVAVPTTLTYCREIARVLNRHCVECHRAGDIGPFALTDYEEILGWGDMILEVVADGRMPPWHADPKHGSFANAREMPEADKQLLRDWVAGGMPMGNPSDLPEPMPIVEGWRLEGGPDQVVAMNEEAFSVPAEGVVEYQYFVTDPGFREDVWINGAEVRPGSRAVVHHCIVFVRPPDGSELSGAGFLSAYVPGQRATTFPKGYARRIPAGSRLVFQMHYTPNGTPQQDLTEIGLKFIPESEVTHEVATVIGINRDFEIPPHAANHSVDGVADEFRTDGQLLAITPHMHFRGRSVTVSAERNGVPEILLDVPRYDFNWQHVYELSEAMPLASIDRLTFTCRFDNSGDNPTNPDPTAHVTWGEQSWEEMAIVFFEVAHPRHGQSAAKPRRQVSSVADEQERLARAAAYAERFFAQFDKNGDGVILREDLPESQRRFGFHRLDRNGDGRLTLDEVRDTALREF